MRRFWLLISITTLGGCGAEPAEEPGIGNSNGASDTDSSNPSSPSAADGAARACPAEALAPASAGAQLCQSFDDAPAGVFYTEQICIQLDADGTGRVDWGGGYRPGSRFVPEGHVREDDIEEFEWGALLGSDGAFARDPQQQQALRLVWQEPGSRAPIEPQLPFLLWDAAAGEFVNSFPTIVATPDEADMTSAACMFGAGGCVTLEREQVCFAAGYRDGPYERYDYLGKVIEEGTFERGRRAGTWSNYSYSGETLASREDRTYGDSEASYSYRKYEGDTLIEEGTIEEGQLHGRVRRYIEPDSASSQVHAAGLLREEGNYERGQKAGVWSEYLVLYDIEFPAGGSSSATSQYYQDRRGIDVCLSREYDHATSVATVYIYGEPGCGLSICNGGLWGIRTNTPGSDSVCVDPEGTVMGCPSSRCQ